jgi:hypothetical protein
MVPSEIHQTLDHFYNYYFEYAHMNEFPFRCKDFMISFVYPYDLYSASINLKCLIKFGVQVGCSTYFSQARCSRLI